ncbi:MAG: aminopeptidase [Eubacteriales bacterium]|nr:aminopeptidase [Eubacteriales bacterium]
MRDSRLASLAKLMLYHSMKIKKGDAFHITADLTARPLVQELLREAALAGALAQVDWTDNEITRQLLELYDPDDGGRMEAFLRDKAEADLRRFENLVGDIVIRAYVNDAELGRIDPAVRQLEATCARPFKDLVINHRRWVLFEYPTQARAQRAGMPYGPYEDFVLQTASLDYVAMQHAVLPLKALMEKTDRVRILAPGTDLSFSIRGIPAVPCCGEYNLPDGECFTAPVSHSANGTITFNTPSLFWGQLYRNIRLSFRDGQIVKASADENTAQLNKILDTDAGARYLGEFALGFNPLIRDATCNTLFDEKIAGSFHLTPGACYDDAPNGNTSAIHWDLVQIQRPDTGGGEIWFDDRLIRKDGLFVLPELSALNP